MYCTVIIEAPSRDLKFTGFVHITYQLTYPSQYSSTELSKLLRQGNSYNCMSTQTIPNTRCSKFFIQDVQEFLI